MKSILVLAMIALAVTAIAPRDALKEATKVLQNDPCYKNSIQDLVLNLGANLVSLHETQDFSILTEVLTGVS